MKKSLIFSIIVLLVVGCSNNEYTYISAETKEIMTKLNETTKIVVSVYEENVNEENSVLIGNMKYNIKKEINDIDTIKNIVSIIQKAEEVDFHDDPIPLVALQFYNNLNEEITTIIFEPIEIMNNNIYLSLNKEDLNNLQDYINSD